MREWTVKSGEKDQRFNKYLQRRLPGAPSSFLYKMLRKKNITLNGKKASGSELLLEGDLVTLFLSMRGMKKADPIRRCRSISGHTGRFAGGLEKTASSTRIRISSLSENL